MMRKETREKNGHIYYLRFFDDWFDFLSLAERVERENVGGVFGGMSCASVLNADASWAGTATLTEAIRLARTGWPEGVVRVRELIHRIDLRKLYPHSERLVRSLDVAGEEPDIGLFLAGEPEHMATLWERKLRERGKVVRIILNRSACCDVHSERIVRRGVAIMLAFEVMRILGYSPELIISYAVRDHRNQHLEHFIPTLRAGDAVNLDTLGFMMIHPSVLRRLVFAVEECESEEIREWFGFYSGRGYGFPVNPGQPPHHDLLIDWEDGLVRSHDEIEPYALRVLKAVGIDMVL